MVLTSKGLDICVCKRSANSRVIWILGLAMLAWQAATRAADRPNIVLILADDLGWGDVGFNGRTSWKTPNLDRLASQGMQLRRFYTGAVVCAPSRAVLLTGKATIHNGVRRNDQDLPAEQVTLAEMLRDAGYRTALFGKWHHGQPPMGHATSVHPMDQGFEQFFGFTDARHAWEKFPNELWDGRTLKASKGHADDLFTDRAVAFLRERKADESHFFLYLPLISAHFNIEAPADEVALHAGRFPEDDLAKPLNATYAAMVTRLDRNVGRVLDVLDECSLAESTIVFFTSDHGATFESGNRGTSAFHDSNAPFRGQKRTLWEGGIRVPAVVRWPGHIKARSVDNEAMHMFDMMPTLAAACGIDAPPDVDGVNLLPAWAGRAPVAERTLCWEWQSEGSDQFAAMRGPFKLVITRGGSPELFDVVNDPAERRDLAASRPDRVKLLKAELDAWLATGNQ